MECTLGNNGEMLQGRYITVTQEHNSFTEKMKKSKITEKYVWQPTQRNYKNGSTTTQKKVIMWRIHLKTMEKRVTVTQEEWKSC